MPINPFQTNAEMSWGGYNTQKANAGVVGGRLGGAIEKGNTGKNPNVAWTDNTLKPTPKAPNAQAGATADMARADYRPDTPPAAAEGRRKGAFGAGGGGKGGYSVGGDLNINLGDNAAVGRGNRAGIGNINGDNNDFSGNSGQIGGSGNRMTPPSRRGTRGAPTSPAGSPPAGTPPAPAPTPGGGKKRTPTPVGGAPTPRALPSGPTPTPAVGTSPTTPTSPPAVGSGPKPKAIGPGTGETPTPAKPQGTKDVRTRKEKIEDLANDPGATPGERSAAQGKLKETPSGPTPKTPEPPALSAPSAPSSQPGDAKQETPSGPQASAPTGLRQRRPVTGFDKRTLEPAGAGKIGPRSYPDGTVDDREYTVGGQRLMPAGQDPGYGGVQPSAVQPKRDTQKSTAPAPAEPSNPSQEKEKVKESAKESVKKATSKPPTNVSQKPKVAMKAKAPVKKQPKKGK